MPRPLRTDVSDASHRIAALLSRRKGFSESRLTGGG
jgi:hypothetical protein